MTSLSLLLRGGTAVAATVFLRPGIQFKSVEGNSPLADRDHAHRRPHQLVEGILVHAQVRRSDAQAQESRWERQSHEPRIEDFSEIDDGRKARIKPDPGVAAVWLARVVVRQIAPNDMRLGLVAPNCNTKVARASAVSINSLRSATLRIAITRQRGPHFDLFSTTGLVAGAGLNCRAALPLPAAVCCGVIRWDVGFPLLRFKMTGCRIWQSLHHSP